MVRTVVDKGRERGKRCGGRSRRTIEYRHETFANKSLMMSAAQN